MQIKNVTVVVPWLLNVLFVCVCVCVFVFVFLALPSFHSDSDGRVEALFPSPTTLAISFKVNRFRSISVVFFS